MDAQRLGRRGDVCHEKSGADRFLLPVLTYVDGASHTVDRRNCRTPAIFETERCGGGDTRGCTGGGSLQTGVRDGAGRCAAIWLAGSNKRY